MADTPNSERSRSRGREVFQSSGSGGIGNIRQPSQSREPRPDVCLDDFSQSRGREPAVRSDGVYSVGRGGAGNLRSPSRDPAVEPLYKDLIDEEVRIRREHAVDEAHVLSTGRGGVLGNISRSRSRSRSPAASSGRGGAANMIRETPSTDVFPDQEQRKMHERSRRSYIIMDPDNMEMVNHPLESPS